MSHKGVSSRAVTPTLSILIASLGSRSHLLRRVHKQLDDQRLPSVELLIDVDDGQMIVGTKRRNLLHKATGDYVCFIDDDDLIHPQYVALILEALAGKPDCVGFYVARYVDGVFAGVQVNSLTHRTYWHGPLPMVNRPDLTIWHRTPNHLSPVRREIALAAGFPPLQRGEDSAYAARIYRKLKSEAFIEEFLYEYWRVSGLNGGAA